MKNTNKLISVLLAAMLLVSAVTVAGISASAATGTLTSYYATNPDGKVGVQKTITMDGDISDWDSSMLIAQGTANDDPRVYRPNSMYEVAEDLYALYGAYDDTNLYLMWEMANVQDMVAPNDNYPLSQGTLYETSEFPLFIFVDTGKTDDAIGNDGKTTTGGTLWDKNITVQNSFNRVIATDTKGNNGPWMYGGSSAGINPVEIYNGSTSGIKVKYGKGMLSQHVYGIDKGYGTYNNRVPGDMCDESSAWVDFNAKGHNSAKYDFHYEVSIPLDHLGITKNDITTNGIGAMLVITSGLSGMDCLPYDLSMNDNADLDDGDHSQEYNSFEKSDEDYITTSFARIGKAGGSAPVTVPTTPTQPTQPTTPTVVTTPTTPTQPTAPSPVTDLTVNAKSNLFNTSTVTGLEVGDTVTVDYKLNANMGVASAMWQLSYDSSKLRLLTPASSLGPAGGSVNTNSNPVIGNFTNASNLYDFNGGKTFVQAEFEVLATGSTDVSLTVEELNLAYKSNNVLYMESVVENSQLKNISSVSGFENATVTANSEATSGSDVPDNVLAVSAASNLFKDASATLNANTGEMTVTYRLQASEKVVNAHWALHYDPTKLTLTNVAHPKLTGVKSGVPADGVETGIYSNLTGADFSTKSDFVVATFDVIGSGKTTVTLDVVDLGVGKIAKPTALLADLVFNHEVQHVSSQSGFAGFTYDTETIINGDFASSFLRGDVDMNGSVTVDDATLLQRYLSEMTTLNSEQLRAADADKNGKVNINDVTAIQRAVAELMVLPD